MLHTKIINAIDRNREFFSMIYKYREYLKQSVARDLRKKYKRSSLGYLWSMLNPLFTMIILTLVFSKIMARIDSYSVFLFSAMLPWQYFNSTAQGSLGAIKGHMKIIEHLPIPKFLFALSIAFSNLVNLFLSIIPLIAVMLVVGRPIHWTVLLFPIALIPLFFMAMGMALMLSVANVFFDDTKHLTGVLFSALYYLCPILYGREHLPDKLLTWIILNPMFCICEFWRDLFYFGRLPDPSTYLINLVASFFVLVLGLWVFKKADDKVIFFV